MKNKHRLFIKMAELVAEQSTCCRLQVGAVLVKDNRVISMGFNGTPTGQLHCEDNFKTIYEQSYRDKFPTYADFVASRTFYDLHGKWSVENELHAEQNAISFAAKNGIATQGASVYVTELKRCFTKICTTAAKTALFFWPATALNAAS